jgi:exonuclease SbcC
MIKKLIIENFQSHEKTELNLDPGVNIITGASQAGKTAILRALYWLLHNRPSGDRIRSNFAKGATKVMIETSEGDSIWHVKDDKINSYALGNEVFDKIGRDIPDMVQRALRISELNVQKQLDEPFLVTSSAGEVAKTINRITRLEMVDNWVTDLTQNINSINREKERLEAEIESSIEKIKSYRVVVDLQPLLDRGKEIDDKIGDLTRKHSDIAYLIEDLTKTKDDRIKLNQKIIVLSTTLIQIEKNQAEIDKRSERAKVARSALKAYRDTQRLKSASELIGKAVAIEEQKVSLGQKSKIITDAKTSQNNFIMFNNRMYQDLSTLKKAMQDFKVCPTCLQPITQSVMKTILGEV